MPGGQIIARKTNTWLVRLYQGRDPATGKRRYLNKTVQGERASAEAELARALAGTGTHPVFVRVARCAHELNIDKRIFLDLIAANHLL